MLFFCIIELGQHPSALNISKIPSNGIEKSNQKKGQVCLNTIGIGPRVLLIICNRRISRYPYIYWGWGYNIILLDVSILIETIIPQQLICSISSHNMGNDWHSSENKYEKLDWNRSMVKPAGIRRMRIFSSWFIFPIKLFPFLPIPQPTYV